MNGGQPDPDTRRDYIELAKLAQQSFSDRRVYEWRINFSLWAALAAVAYFALKEKIRIFDSEITAYAAGFFLLLLYVRYMWLVYHSHLQDKNLKHLYLSRATGDAHDTQLTMKYQRPWLLVSAGFTLCLIFFAIRLLLSVEPSGTGTQAAETAAKPAASQAVPHGTPPAPRP